jgi:hypothetical protein
VFWARLFTRCVRSVDNSLAVPAAAMLLLAYGIACESPNRAAPVLTDRSTDLGKSYTHLSSSPSHYYVLADFESDQHMSGFHANKSIKVTPSPGSQSGNVESDTNQTLTVVLADNDTLRLNLRDGDLPRPTDWRGIPLLTFGLFSPQDGRIQVRLATGPEPQLIWQRTFTLTAGWQTLAVDLAEAVEYVDLADVREVSWRWLGPAMELKLSELRLVDDSRWIVPLDARAPDTLAVLERGRRIHVGVPGAFELVFSQGMIVGWYDRPRELGSGRRLIGPGGIDTGPIPPAPNLVDSPNLSHLTGLGPYPTPLSADWPSDDVVSPRFDDPRQFKGWGHKSAYAAAHPRSRS